MHTHTHVRTHTHTHTHTHGPVSEVSAIFVATTHFLTPSGAFWNILACRSDGSWEYMGRMASGGESSNSDNRSTQQQQQC